MKKKTLSLNLLKVKSFVTNLNSHKEQTVKSGREGSGFQLCNNLNVTFEDCTNGNPCIIDRFGDSDTHLTIGGVLCGAQP